METARKTFAITALFALFCASGALAADAQVQQQLQQREQQQMELRLKMQQQLDRATQLPSGIQVPPGIQAPGQTTSPQAAGQTMLPGMQAPVGSSADLRRQQLERDQQQRLRQLQDLQSRGLIAPAPAGVAGQTGLELERQRAQMRSTEELRQFEMQRRSDGGP